MSEYTCASCGATFEKGWSDEESAAEREEVFPGLPESECALVCEDCYRALNIAFGFLDGRGVR